MAWITSLVGHTSWRAVFTHIDQAMALRSTGLAWSLAALGASREYQRVEPQHWQKDCLQIAATADKQQLHSGEHATVTVSGVTAGGGPLSGPVPLTITADGGTVTPTSATFGGTPVPLDYAAQATKQPSGSVTITGKSRMGVGQTTVDFGPVPLQERVRLTSEVTQAFDGGADGTGSASWAVAADVPVTSTEVRHPDADPTWQTTGSGPLGFTGFSYARHALPASCQDGKYGSEDIDGTTTDPGTLTVDQLVNATTDDQVYEDLTVEIAPPTEHYHNNFVYEPTTACSNFADDTAWPYWGASLKGLGSPAQPGVSFTWSPSGTVIHVTGGWQRGTGDVVAYRDLSFSTSTGDAEPMQGHLRLEVVER